MTFSHFPLVSRIYLMAGHQLTAYIVNPKSLALHVVDVPAVMVIEGARRCCTQILPLLPRHHRYLTSLYHPSSS
jgi:hypothetical protein